MAKLADTSLSGDADLVSSYNLDGDSVITEGITGNGSDTNMSYSTDYGKYDQGSDFQSNGSIISASNTGVTGTEARSMGCWFYCHANTLNMALVGHGYYQTGAAGWTLFANRDEGGVGAVGTNIAGTGSAYTSSGQFSNNEWVHVVMNYPSGGGVDDVTFWINGSSVANQTAQTNTPNTTNTKLYIGVAYAATNFGYFNGWIDEPFLFNRELTESEIGELYADGGASGAGGAPVSTLTLLGAG